MCILGVLGEMKNTWRSTKMKRFHGWNHVQSLDIEGYQQIKGRKTYNLEDLSEKSDDTWERMSSLA